MHKGDKMHYLNNISLNSLNLSNRTLKALEAANINTLADLMNIDINAINLIKNIGDKALGEIIDLRRQALINSRASYDPNQLLIYIREKMPELRELTDQEILNLDVLDVFELYNKPYYIFELPHIGEYVEQRLPYYGSQYPLFNILASIADIEACRSVSELAEYLFRDFSEMERKVLLTNFDGKQRAFAKLGEKNRLSRERIRQIYQIAVKKFQSPYQRHRQSGFILYISIISHVHKDDFLIDWLHYHFRGRSKKLLTELTILTKYHWSKNGFS